MTLYSMVHTAYSILRTPCSVHIFETLIPSRTIIVFGLSGNLRRTVFLYLESKSVSDKEPVLDHS